jgi:hypothetical protein
VRSDTVKCKEKNAAPDAFAPERPLEGYAVDQKKYRSDCRVSHGSLTSRINDRESHENLGVLYLAFTFEVPTGQAALDSSLLPAFSSRTYRALRRARITMTGPHLRIGQIFTPGCI